MRISPLTTLFLLPAARRASRRLFLCLRRRGGHRGDCFSCRRASGRGECRHPPSFRRGGRHKQNVFPHPAAADSTSQLVTARSIIGGSYLARLCRFNRVAPIITTPEPTRLGTASAVGEARCGRRGLARLRGAAKRGGARHEPPYESMSPNARRPQGPRCATPAPPTAAPN